MGIPNSFQSKFLAFREKFSGVMGLGQMFFNDPYRLILPKGHQI
jgi:hypothetical protein